jgi:DNA-binding response OmpR family regulator
LKTIRTRLKVWVAVSRALRIVVVEDLDDSRELLAELLAMHGHAVKTAHDGESGVALICAEKPDVAIVDIGLPRKNGYEVAREVRLVLRDGAPRLVAVTGYCQDADRVLAEEAGFDAHVPKPASRTDLLAALYAERARA